eukprot:13972805-Alexandrium_andersonii.AAC.1
MTCRTCLGRRSLWSSRLSGSLMRRSCRLSLLPGRSQAQRLPLQSLSPCLAATTGRRARSLTSRT